MLLSIKGKFQSSRYFSGNSVSEFQPALVDLSYSYLQRAKCTVRITLSYMFVERLPLPLYVVVVATA